MIIFCPFCDLYTELCTRQGKCHVCGRNIDNMIKELDNKVFMYRTQLSVIKNASMRLKYPKDLGVLVTLRQEKKNKKEITRCNLG